MLPIPEDVGVWLRGVFETCNRRVAEKLSRIPTAHETSLDLTFVEHFSRFSAPIRFPSEWVVSIDTHYLGGMRHFDPWEIADIGLLVIFRQNGRLVRSKIAQLQSKRLYPIEEEFNEDHTSYCNLGFGRLLPPDEPWAAIVGPRVFSFTLASRYRALRVKDGQYTAITEYEKQIKVPVHYLLYHPLTIPWSVTLPITEGKDPDGACEVGCRVVPTKDARSALKKKEKGYMPLLGDFQFLLPPPFTEQANAAGWRLEDFVCELLLKCKEGYIADDREDARLFEVFNRRSGPIAAAVAITFDAPAGGV